MALARDYNGRHMQVAGWGGAQALSFAASAAQSASINAPAVRLCATSDCYVAVGANPVASVASALLPAGAVEFVAISPGDKVSALQGPFGAGSLSIVEVG